MPYGCNPEFEKKLFKQKKPKIPAPVAMPDEQDPAAVEARRQREMALVNMSGRAATRLQGGGGDYGRSGL